VCVIYWIVFALNRLTSCHGVPAVSTFPTVRSLRKTGRHCWRHWSVLHDPAMCEGLPPLLQPGHPQRQHPPALSQLGSCRRKQAVAKHTESQGQRQMYFSGHGSIAPSLLHPVVASDRGRNISTRSRPPCLARYIARSASSTSRLGLGTPLGIRHTDAARHGPAQANDALDGFANALSHHKRLVELGIGQDDAKLLTTVAGYMVIGTSLGS